MYQSDLKYTPIRFSKPPGGPPSKAPLTTPPPPPKQPGLQALLAEAARRASAFQEELDAQRRGLCNCAAYGVKMGGYVGKSIAGQQLNTFLLMLNEV